MCDAFGFVLVVVIVVDKNFVNGSPPLNDSAFGREGKSSRAEARLQIAIQLGRDCLGGIVVVGRRTICPAGLFCQVPVAFDRIVLWIADFLFLAGL